MGGWKRLYQCEKRIFSNYGGSGIKSVMTPNAALRL